MTGPFLFFLAMMARRRLDRCGCGWSRCDIDTARYRAREREGKGAVTLTAELMDVLMLDARADERSDVVLLRVRCRRRNLVQHFRRTSSTHRHMSCTRHSSISASAASAPGRWSTASAGICIASGALEDSPAAPHRLSSLQRAKANAPGRARTPAAAAATDVLVCISKS